MHLAQLDWGSVPEWVSGVGSLIALLFAFLAVRAAHKTTIQQGQELEAMQRDRRQLQASKVSAWITTSDSQLTCKVQNASDAPVVAAHVFLYNRSADGERRHWRKIRIFILPPGTLNLPISSSPEPIPAVREADYTPVRVAMIFTDSDGREWKRDIRGGLEGIEKEVSKEVYRACGDEWAEFAIRSTIERQFRPHDPRTRS